MFASLHPFVTHFPIAALAFAFIAECYCVIVQKDTQVPLAVFMLLLAASLSTVLAFVTGLSAAEGADVTFMVPDEAVAAHYTVARLALLMVPVTTVLQFASRSAEYHRSIFLSVYRIFLVLSFVNVGYAGLLGGQLVFSYGAGVSAPAESLQPQP